MEYECCEEDCGILEGRKFRYLLLGQGACSQSRRGTVLHEHDTEEAIVARSHHRSIPAVLHLASSVNNANAACGGLYTMSRKTEMLPYCEAGGRGVVELTVSTPKQEPHKSGQARLAA